MEEKGGPATFHSPSMAHLPGIKMQAMSWVPLYPHGAAHTAVSNLCCYEECSIYKMMDGQEPKICLERELKL